jgi:hypothetical protein
VTGREIFNYPPVDPEVPADKGGNHGARLKKDGRVAFEAIREEMCP